MIDIRPSRLAGRCSSGAERDRGKLTHAVPVDERKALCGARPGRQSAGWAFVEGPVTCKRCLPKVLDAIDKACDLSAPTPTEATTDAET